MNTPTETVNTNSHNDTNITNLPNNNNEDRVDLTNLIIFVNSPEFINMTIELLLKNPGKNGLMIITH
ncbi:MAG: hypothetical protein CXT73_06655 [Methanobacteriota archaeon]|nr:MAG: hypothetical protein CXT73_06655 [Euryarchaeota archaeon]